MLNRVSAGLIVSFFFNGGQQLVVLPLNWVLMGHVFGQPISTFNQDLMISFYLLIYCDVNKFWVMNGVFLLSLETPPSRGGDVSHSFWSIAKIDPMMNLRTLSSR